MTETANIDALAATEANRKGPPQAQLLAELAGEWELFRTPEGDGYATFPVDDHHETWLLRSRPAREWLTHRFYRAFSRPPGNQALTDAVNQLEATARFEGIERPVFLRVGEAGDGVYLDLGSEQWAAVEITREGWRITTTPPVRFRRSRSLMPLPHPIPGGHLDELRRFVNVADETAWHLLVAWLIAALFPTGPYPILVLQGEQGSAKSTVARVLRALVDPATAPLRTAPRDERDLMIGAMNGRVQVFDNLSGLPVWLSDGLCRLSTGGGLSTRALYSDHDEMIFDAQRPVMLNGIDDLAVRQDLIDRSVVIMLPAIAEDARRAETEFWADFEQVRPRILGALLNVVSTALRNLGTVRLPSLPRMADFAKRVEAAAPALGWPSGAFLDVYSGNRRNAIDVGLDASLLADAIRTLLDTDGEWTGSASALLHHLNTATADTDRQSKTWPKAPHTLSNQLRRLAPALRTAGYEVELDAGRDRRNRKLLLLRKSGQNSVHSVRSVSDRPDSPVDFTPQNRPNALNAEIPGSPTAHLRAGSPVVGWDGTGWPAELPGLGPRTIGAFTPCGNCRTGTFARYGERPLCSPCAQQARPNPFTLDSDTAKGAPLDE
jgi:hypothetical protein